jgi:hypothetical protein
MNTMRARELGLGGSSIGAVAAALALPKCPLCVVGFLSAIGIGGSFVEAVVPLLRPAALTIGLVLAVVLVAFLVARRGWRRSCRDCSGAWPPEATERAAGAHASLGH